MQFNGSSTQHRFPYGTDQHAQVGSSGYVDRLTAPPHSSHGWNPQQPPPGYVPIEPHLQRGRRMLVPYQDETPDEIYQRERETYNKYLPATEEELQQFQINMRSLQEKKKKIMEKHKEKHNISQKYYSGMTRDPQQPVPETDPMHVLLGEGRKDLVDQLESTKMVCALYRVLNSYAVNVTNHAQKINVSFVVKNMMHQISCCGFQHILCVPKEDCLDLQFMANYHDMFSLVADMHDQVLILHLQAERLDLDFRSIPLTKRPYLSGIPFSDPQCDKPEQKNPHAIMRFRAYHFTLMSHKHCLKVRKKAQDSIFAF